jgi:3-hydroxyisobutyrate dehydrogenase
VKVGWVGVGKMGLPMASHLLAAGHAVTACDSAASAVQALVARGARIAESPAAAARDAEVVFSSIPDDAALRAVAKGVFAAARSGTVYVDTSTVSPEASADVAAAASAKGVHYLRVCVSGNNKMAEAKALTVIASGDKVVYEKCQPLLAEFGPTQYYVGEAEQARTLKLAINLMVYATVGGLAEALVLGERGGVDWEQMLDVMAASAIGSPLLKNKSADLKKRDYSATFSCLQARKDLALINGAAAASAIPAPLAAELARLIEECIAHGSADEDYAAMIKAVRRRAEKGSGAG